MAFNLPVQNYFRKTEGPPSSFTRPVDWPVIIDAAAEVQFLFCDLGDAACSIRTTFSRTSGPQNITIDWGDGTASAVTTTNSTTTAHTYTPGSGTPCSLGYTTFVIRVYFTGAGISVLSNCNILPVLISGDTSSHQNCAVLEAYYGDSTQNATPVNFYSLGTNATSLGVYGNLQFVKLPASVTWTSWVTTFYQCTALLKVVMPTSNSAMASLNQAFFGCASLLDIRFPSNATGITNLGQAFNGCTNLRTVTFPTTMNSCTDISLVFLNCSNLRFITFPSINAATTLSQCFLNCTQLLWVKFTSMPTGIAVNIQGCFQSCVNLQNVYFPATGTEGSVYNFNTTFSSCTQLKSIVLPSNINVSTFASTFIGCVSLISCILPTSAAACTSYTSIFNACNSLIKVKLPGAPSSSVSLAGAFSGCIKLQEVIIPAGYVFASMDSTFQNCYSLKTLTWTPGIQNSLASLNNTFLNCYILQSITMPSSMTALTTLANTFANCYLLTSVTLPASLNLVTGMQFCFQQCYALGAVTLPTSMSVVSLFNNTFLNCKSISSITLPATVGVVTTFSFTFSGCISLKTCVLPLQGASQLSAVTNINNMFAQCSNLTTLTNFAKIGSLTATPLMSATGILYNRFSSGSAISFSGPLSALALNGGSATQKADVQSVRLTNTSAGQWTGASPQINISNTNMSTAQIVQLFNDMAAQPSVVSKTINITTATGTSGLTAPNRAIVTNKGWTITG